MRSPLLHDTVAALFSRCLLLAASLLISAATPAQELAVPADETAATPELRRYSVELIVFENSSAVVSGNELFRPEELPQRPDVTMHDDLVPADGLVSIEDLAEPSPEDLSPIEAAAGSVGFGDLTDAGDAADTVAGEVIDLNTPLEEIVGYDYVRWTRIDPEQFTMTEIYDKLVLLDAYTPVLHSGWIQVTFDEEFTPTVRLRSLGPVPLRFGGGLTLYLGRYLHLVVDLTLEHGASNPTLLHEFVRQLTCARRHMNPYLPQREYRNRSEMRLRAQFRCRSLL